MQRLLDHALLSFLGQLDDALQRTITSKEPTAELVTLLSDTRLLRARLSNTTSPETGKPTDTWTRNGSERLAKIRAYMGNAHDACDAPDDDSKPTDTGRVLIELVKARREALWLVEFLDAYISSFIPDDDDADTPSA